MGKMSQLHAELSVEAAENGYDSITEYLADKEHQEAHDEWVKKREMIIGDLLALLIGMQTAGKTDTMEYNIIRRTIDFIREGSI